MSDLPTILYVAGYSRSGSTILDIVLGGHPQIASTGELLYLLDDARRSDRVCTCGEGFTSCEVYGEWLQGVEDPENVNATLREIESRAGVKRLLAGEVPADKARIYRDYARSLFAHVAEKSGARVIVDSSKSAKDAAGRPLALARLAGLDVRVLHLSRSPQATIGSYVERGSNWVLEGYRKPKPLETWRPILGWTYANRIAGSLSREFGEGYHHLRFEDFLADPSGALQRVGALIGEDLDGIAKDVVAGRRFSAGHNVGGNRHRMTPQAIQLKPARPASLPAAHALAMRLVGSGTARQLGY
jgi:hypothetical protein